MRAVEVVEGKGFRGAGKSLCEGPGAGRRKEMKGGPVTAYRGH